MYKADVRSLLGALVLVAQALGINGCNDGSSGRQDSRVDTAVVADRGSSDTSAGSDQRTGGDQRTAGCPCPSAGLKRCTTKGVQTCAAGQWIRTKSCAADEVCVLDECVSLGTGCPTAASDYDGNTVVVERFAPVRVGDCLDGGTSGREVTFVDSSSESHSRTLDFQFLSGGSCSASDLRSSVDFSAAFGMPVDAPVESSQQQYSLTGGIEAGERGQFYRQTSRVFRVVKLLRDGKIVGIATLTDWTFAPELVTGSTCPVPSKLPSAGVLSPYCLTSSENCDCP